MLDSLNESEFNPQILYCITVRFMEKMLCWLIYWQPQLAKEPFGVIQCYMALDSHNESEFNLQILHITV